MSKELTEQWRNGTLEESMYYVKLPDNDIPIVNLYQLKQLALVNDADEIEVLAPVPTYQEWLESESHCAVYSEVNKWNKDKIKKLEDQFADVSKKVEKLEKQLKEAEDVIRFYANTDGLNEEEKRMTGEKYHLVYGLKAYDYIERYGVK